MKMKSESEGAQSCPTLSDHMDCSLPDSSVHGIFQARVLEWGAIAPNRSRRYFKKRWQEHTEELYKKDLHDPDNHNDVITHLEPDILECQVGLRKHHYEQS